MKNIDYITIKEAVDMMHCEEEELVRVPTSIMRHILENVQPLDKDNLYWKLAAILSEGKAAMASREGVDLYPYYEALERMRGLLDFQVFYQNAEALMKQDWEAGNL